MPAPKPILRCHACGHDLSDLITAPWIRRCPECGAPFDREFFYDGQPPEHPEPNALPPETPAPGETTPLPDNSHADSQAEPRDEARDEPQAEP